MALVGPQMAENTEWTTSTHPTLPSSPISSCTAAQLTRLSTNRAVMMSQVIRRSPRASVPDRGRRWSISGRSTWLIHTATTMLGTKSLHPSAWSIQENPSISGLSTPSRLEMAGITVPSVTARAGQAERTPPCERWTPFHHLQHFIWSSYHGILHGLLHYLLPTVWLSCLVKSFLFFFPFVFCLWIER